MDCGSNVLPIELFCYVLVRGLLCIQPLDFLYIMTMHNVSLWLNKERKHFIESQRVACSIPIPGNINFVAGFFVIM